MNKNLIRLIVLTAGIILLVGGFIVALFAYNSNTVPIVVAPTGATILLDGKEIANESRHWVKYGNHTIKISAEGYETLEEKLSEQGTGRNEYLFCLTPISDKAFENYKNSERDASVCEGYEGRRYDELTRRAIEKNPLINELPFNNGLFSIGQGKSQKYPNNPEQSGVYVHYYNDASLEDAKKWISDRVDINSIEVIYEKDYVDNRTAGVAGVSFYSQLAKNYPLVDKLPFKDPYYTISYRSNNENDFSLVIYTPSPRYRYGALNQIRAFGYDPSDFVIEFLNYKNPLES